VTAFPKKIRMAARRQTDKDRVEPEQWSTEVRHHFWVTTIVSGVVLVAALYVLLSQRYPPEGAKWATGVIGLVVGYWLHRPIKS
jgi:hypothetical protein